MTERQRARRVWIKLYQETGDAGFVCRRCGISRPTLRKWVQRYEASGEEGLQERSRRPRFSPNRKVTPEIEALILGIRKDRHLGAKQLSNELLRLHEVTVSPPTIQKVLIRHQSGELPARLKRRKHPKRYSRPIPGDRVQMDVCKIAPGLYHYAAIDDCTRYKVVAIYSRRTASNTIRFLEQVLDEMPFPVQRIQTDRGREFFAVKVQEWLQQHCIKFRPVKPYSPHLNGKIERGHKTALQDFYATIDLKDPELPMRLAEWQHYYNWQRPHSSLQRKTPVDRCLELSAKTPFWDQVEAEYDPNQEPLRGQNYIIDKAINKLK